MTDSTRVTTDWWSTFFSGAALDVLRVMYGDEVTRGEVDFIAKSLELREGANVLDAPCGNGRLSLGLLERGLRVTGVDIAPELIEEALRRSHERGLVGRFESREMRDLPWKGEFDAAFCFGNSFGYLDDAGNEQFLRAVHDALRPGGRLLLDAACIAEHILPNLSVFGSSWGELGEWFLGRRAEHDPTRSRLDVEYTFVREGRVVERKSASYRVYTYLELTRLLERVGFAECRGFSALSERPYETGKPLHLLAVRA